MRPGYAYRDQGQLKAYSNLIRTFCVSPYEEIVGTLLNPQGQMSGMSFNTNTISSLPNKSRQDAFKTEKFIPLESWI
jgi:hypothetical protein